MIYLGLFVGIGGASFIALIAQTRPLPGRTETWIAGAMVGGLMASVVSLGLQGLDGLALPLTQLWRPDVWMSGLATSYGWTALVAAAAMLLGLASLRATKPALVGLCASCALAGAGFALALSGHAATAGPSCSAGRRSSCMASASRSGSDRCFRWRRSCATGGRGEGELARFSRLIPLPLAVLIATGAIWPGCSSIAPTRCGRPSYGEVLSGKLAAVLALLGLAAANRFVLVPRRKRAGRARRVRSPPRSRPNR